MITVKRGDIYYADLSPVVGSEQGGMRPVLIIQNDVGNRYSPTVIAAAITSRMGKTKLPTHIDIYAERAGLARDSIVLLEQLRTLDKRRLKEKMGHLDEGLMADIDTAIAVSLGLLPHGARMAKEAVTPRPYSPEATGERPITAVAAVTSQSSTPLPAATDLRASAVSDTSAGEEPLLFT
jgi:mRNA interferase MazF